MQFPLVGPAYEHPSIDVNNQRCLNMFLFSSGPEGRGNGALLPTSGLELLTDISGLETRALNTFFDVTYSVVDNKVYKVEINELTEVATVTEIGTIGTSTGTVYAAANPTQIIWVDGSSEGYIYTPGTDTFEAITPTAPDFPGGGQVVFIDGYFVVNKPDSGQFFFSALNDGLSWSAADVATAESSTDNIVGLGVSRGELWIFGQDTIEIWYNAGNPTGAPFSPRDGLEIQIGCGSADSIIEIDDLLIWLDNRGFIVQSSVSPYLRDNNSGYQLNIVSTEALTAEILSYLRRDDAIGMTYNDRGHLMYQVSFPTVKKTWVFDYTSRVWHERSYYNEFDGAQEHHLTQFHTEFKQLNVAAGIRDGKIYLSKSTVYDDDGVAIYRIRTTPPEYEKEEQRLVGIDHVELRVESGLANQSGEGSDPKISMRYSDNGGHTWSFSLQRSMGKVGEYAKRIRWNRLGIASEWVFEFTIVEPIDFSLIEGFARVTEIEQ